MDRYISLRYKGLGAAKVNQPSTTDGKVYVIKCTLHWRRNDINIGVADHNKIK